MDNHAKLADVEIRVHRLHRIERPFDPVDPRRQGFFPLPKFQCEADIPIPILLDDSRQRVTTKTGACPVSNRAWRRKSRCSGRSDPWPPTDSRQNDCLSSISVARRCPPSRYTPTPASAGRHRQVIIEILGAPDADVDFGHAAKYRSHARFETLGGPLRLLRIGPIRPNQMSTERRNPRSVDIDLYSTERILKIINTEDASVANVVGVAIPELVKVVDLAVEAIKNGGESFTSAPAPAGGWPCWMRRSVRRPLVFPPETIQAVFAGGAKAFAQAKEDAEDDTEQAVTDLRQRRFQIWISWSDSRRAATRATPSALSNLHGRAAPKP